ncbi:venom protease-like [Oratosquilla oratoria]|uniref:venom protease-like n=1 Tax=Oratosquilla oratoria TaxID=337810 RepID=UPI003F76199E
MAHHLLVWLLTLLAVAFIPSEAVSIRRPRQAFAFPTEEQGCPCVFLRNCPSILALLKDRSKENIQKIRAAICGFHNNQPKVTCCPVGPSPLQDPKLLSLCGDHRIPDRIFNGEEADYGEYPWVAALGYIEKGFPNKPTKFQCGGGLISDRYVITAAHCVRDLRLFELSLVRMGEHTLSTEDDCKVLNNGNPKCSDPHEDYNIEKVIVHPNYESRTVANDIALIRLDRKVEFTVYINPVCLPPPNIRASVLADGVSPEVAGWGYTEKGATSDELLRVVLPLADLKQCNETTGRGTLKETQLCAGGKGGKDSCQGDSGGPLVLGNKSGPPYRLIGLTSYGLSCGEEGFPGVYTSVSHYIDWITENVLP